MKTFETLEQCQARKLKAIHAKANVTEHTTHVFTLTRPFAVKPGDRDIVITAERKEGKITQSYVNEIAAHISKVEADPKYTAPPPYKRWPS